MLRDNQQLSLKSNTVHYSCVISPETFYPLAHPTANSFYADQQVNLFQPQAGKCSSGVSITTEWQEVQLRRLPAFLINAAFILPRRGNMGAVQGDHWYLMILIFLPFLKGKVQIWLYMFEF